MKKEQVLRAKELALDYLGREKTMDEVITELDEIKAEIKEEAECQEN